MTHHAATHGRSLRAFRLAVMVVMLGAVAVPPSAQAQLTTGLQTYFDFETGTISNVVAGASGYTPTITNSGTPVSGFTGSGARPLLVGNSLNLIRSENDFFSIVNIGSGALTPVDGLNLAGTFTLSAWHYLDPAAGSAISNRYYVWEGTTDFDVSYGTGGNTSGPDSYTAYATSATGLTVSLPRNTWNNIVQVFSNDGTNITGNLYINGQFIGSNTTLLSTMNWSGLRYGNARAGGGRGWDGTLDEVGVWNTSLTGAQAQEVYIRGLQGTGLTAATSGVGSWSSTAAGNEWTTAADWTAGAVLGATAASAGSNNAVAIFGGYSLATGLGIDMSAAAANGALGLGAIVLDSASGSLRIGNSSADTNGLLRLNGATTGAGPNTLLYVAGQSDLVIADSPDAASPATTTLGVTLGIANGTISVGPGRTATIESTIGEATAGSGFTKTGNGTLVLSGANTYTGPTTISAGTVSVPTTASLPGWDASGRFSLASGATLAVGNAVVDGDVATLVATGNLAAGSVLGFDTASGNRAITASVSGTYGLGKLSGNTLSLSAGNSYTGPTAISGGTLALVGAGDVTSSSGLTLSAATAAFDISAADGARTIAGLSGVTGSSVSLGPNSLTVNAAAAVTFGGGITGTGSLIKSGTAALTLSGSSTHSGGTTIRAGSIVASAGSATLGMGTVTLNDPQTGSAATGITVNAELAYGMPLTVANEGSGVSTVTFSGAVTSDAGRTPFTTITLDRAATLDFQTSGAYAFNSPISGTGPLTIAGNNSYKLAGGSWSGYSGPVTIASGAAIDFRNRLGVSNNTSQLTVNGTMWVVSEETLGPLAGSGSITTNLAYGSGTRSLIIGAGDATGTFSGVLGEASGAAPLRITKTGTGTQTLSGANTFTGGSTVAAGTLALSGAGKLGGNTSPIALTGGRLDLTGTNQTTGALTISAAAAAGDTISAGTLTSTSYAVSNASGNVSLTAGLAGAGALTKTGAGSLTLAATSTFSGGAAVNAGTLSANAASALGTGTTTVASGATLEIGHVNALQGSTLSPAAGSVISFNAGAGTYAIGGLSGAVDLNAGANSLVVGGTNVSSTYGGKLTAAALEKVGTGTFTLTNTGHALGGVTVAGGTLVAMNAAALGGGSITLAGGALNYAMAEVSNAVSLSGAAATNSFSFSTEVEYLVIGGGGGGGGRDVGGGGGAGGYRSSVAGELSGRNSAAEPKLLLAPGTISVVVGGGGAGGPDQTGNTQGKQGGNSSFGLIVATGGGGGNAYNSPAATNGGSGGGGAGLTVLTPNAGLAGEGFGGGTGTSSGTSYGGAGGGGAGGAGANATSTRAGGIGIASSITGTSVFRAGGGGGAGHRSSGNGSLGAGGQGGGGSATVNGGTASSGVANTGGGGGASRAAGAGGGAGGSGVVIVRYAGPQSATGGTVDTTSVPGSTIHSFTTVGSAESFVLAPRRTVSGAITGTGGFSFNSPASTLVLSGNNSYQGGTIVGGGTVTVGSATALGTGPLEVAAGGTVAFDTPGISTHALPVVSGVGTLSASGKTLTIGADNSSSSFAGTITASAFEKQGSGLLRLSGSNTIGGTTISGGTLFAGSSGALGSGRVTLAGGQLRIAPGTTLANEIVLSAAAASTTVGSVVVDYLVVGGGGGGAGRDGGGGGGAGGVLSNLLNGGSALAAAGTYAVTVGTGGTGGAGGTNTATQGQNGTTSILGSLTAIGGGGGGWYAGTASQGGSLGGSGGGGGRGEVNRNPGAGTEGQGFAGGSGTGGSASNNAAGGGGGAGGVGGSGQLGVKGGDGGIGIALSISGTETYYGGGGGGSVYRIPSPSTMAGGAGGLGGGGAASTARGAAPTAGSANTGGGGGASRNDTTNNIGGAGGSGIVVVRYPGDPIATGGAITSGTGTSLGYTIHTFTAGTDTLAFTTPLDSAISGNLTGSGGFTWDSAGTLTLSGSNTFQGGAIISAGTLVAASASALGSGTATVASGARLRLDPAAIIANPIANLGTGSFLGSLDFAGGGLARSSTAGGTTQGTLLAGSTAAPAALNPAIDWLARTGDTDSDIMRLTNTAGTAQVLSLTYDSGLAPSSPQDAVLGWFDTNTTDWVNAIDGNVGGTGSFFQGSWAAYLSANPGATPSSALGTHGHDSATRTVWAVVNHNSDFAVIVVPEPGTLGLGGFGVAGFTALLRRRRRRCPHPDVALGE